MRHCGRALAPDTSCHARDVRIAVRRDGRALVVRELDAVEGTPVVDIKPVMREFLPREEVRQPAWASELMREYWSKAE